MGARIKVYAGLSIEAPQVRAVLPKAVVAPPIQRGDILQDIADRVNVVLVLDGRFHQSLSVSPSEIMDAMRCGLRVYGASSMGALRAAELAPYGMVGCGDVFEHIRSQGEFRDDFLGQLFADARVDLRLESAAYLDLYLNLKTLHAKGRIPRNVFDRVCELYHELHYTERSPAALAGQIRARCRSPEPLLRAADLALTRMARPKLRDALSAVKLVGRHLRHIEGLNQALGGPSGTQSRRRASRPNGHANGAPGAGMGPSTGTAPELGAPYPAMDILQGLERSEPILYCENGNRSARPGDVRRRLQRIMPIVGATRLAEISQLATHSFPVFQSTRPAPWGHTISGTTTGAQGKGRTATQARISCLVETVEGYCVEPRNVQLVRGSYRFLEKQHPVADPRQFTHAINVRRVRLGEPLMWTEALSLEHRTPALVPAELVFFDFFPTDYETRSVFPCSTHGAGAGATYLESVTHALYECIEGHYEGSFEAGVAAIRRLRMGDATPLGIDLARAAGPECRIHLFTAMLPRIRNLPFVLCHADTEDTTFVGSGCSANADVAVVRAVSEALQAMSATYSGSREDLEDDEEELGSGPNSSERRSLPYATYKTRVENRTFRDLRAEYRFLLRWLRRAGFPSAYVANLNRMGIDFPVVKAVVSGMLSERNVRLPSEHCTTDVIRQCYGIT